MQLSDFDYELPERLIAQRPLAERSASRLLLVPAAGPLEDRRFGELAGLLHADDLLVFNDTRVLPARLAAVKDSGGRVEILAEGIIGPYRLRALTRSSKPLRVGAVLQLGEAGSAECVARSGEHAELRFSRPVREVLGLVGEVPLPPYIRRRPEPEDEARYQTIFARNEGASAAPTAGLHFDPAMMADLRAAGVGCEFITLHVGSGTFQPVRVDDPRQHRMHAEWVSVSARVCQRVAQARALGARVVAVGTTTVRALETAALGGELQPFEGPTELYILPGFDFRCVDALVTNFHLPRSTLLMMVSAFAGRERVLRAYRHAVAREYRFFSYGDAMLVARAGRR